MNFTTTQLTCHDYRLLPDDGKRYEIIEGDLCLTPAPVTGRPIKMTATPREAVPVLAVQHPHLMLSTRDVRATSDTQ